MNKNSVNSGLIVSWGKSIQRSKTLAKTIGCVDIHIKPVFSSKILLPINYLISLVVTIYQIIYKKPDLVIVVSPPIFTVYIAVFIRSIFFRNFSIWCDLHNGVLRREWCKWPFFSYVLSKSDLVISHNKYVKNKIDDAFNISSVVITDPLFDCESSANYSQFMDTNRINILVPVSYAKDEPIKEILHASEELYKAYNFILTGNYLKMYSKIDVDNINATFTGYISNDEYKSLLNSSDIVMCLTKDPDIQMCALIESISCDKNIVCTDNPVNREYFSKYGCVFTDNNAKRIVNAIINMPIQDNETDRAIFKSDYMKDWREEVSSYQTDNQGL